jgi:hypothetical protein
LDYKLAWRMNLLLLLLLLCLYVLQLSTHYLSLEGVVLVHDQWGALVQMVGSREIWCLWGVTHCADHAEGVLATVTQGGCHLQRAVDSVVVDDIWGALEEQGCGGGAACLDHMGI